MPFTSCEELSTMRTLLLSAVVSLAVAGGLASPFSDNDDLAVRNDDLRDIAEDFAKENSKRFMSFP